MKSIVCVGASMVMAASLLAEPLERSLSPSRQFVIYGTDAPLRGAVSDAAEQVKTDLLSILRQPDNWKTPIVIHLQFPQANVPDIPAADLHVSQTGSGLKLQLDLVISANVKAPEIQRELLRVIVLERMYRHQTDIAPGAQYVQPPEWLLDGLLAAAPGFDRAPLADAIVPDRIVPLEEFLQRRPDQLDSPARGLSRMFSRPGAIVNRRSRRCRATHSLHRQSLVGLERSGGEFTNELSGIEQRRGGKTLA
ncbi:MAG: hypothetical protein ABJB69_07005 [Spartobacteria bacterium]